MPLSFFSQVTWNPTSRKTTWFGSFGGCPNLSNYSVKVVLPAAITVDRFHVTKILHEELNQGRINQKKTAESLEIKPRQNYFPALKYVNIFYLKENNL
ncbi:MAG TPA: hypothetical protein DDW76_28340 [Cyanobacteria bacterium UBA11369]|nr:hypothetical protein [Cyanobacteria bacterium UBA11371]HBE52571.1 hypothetical protein [Cyanobacteria bacterium UBA11369]